MDLENVVLVNPQTEQFLLIIYLLESDSIETSEDCVSSFCDLGDLAR